MAGPNTTGIANPNDYKLGRGILYFSLLDPATQRPLGWRDLGNSSEFTLTTTSETLDHRSSRTGLSVLDKQITLSRDSTFSFLLEEFNDQNIALLMSGDYAGFVNPTVAGFAEHTAYSNVELGKWYDIVDDDGNRAYDVAAANLTVKAGVSSTPSTPLVLDTDYRLDAKMGRIFLLSTAVDVANSDYISLTLTANAYAAATVNEVRFMTRASVEGALKFIEENPVDNSSNNRREWVFPKVTLTADGDMSMIGDDWATLPFSGAVQSNELASPNSPYGYARSVPSAA